MSPSRFTMKYLVGIATATLLFAGLAHAEGDIWQCTDDSGITLYKNTGTGKGCKKVEVDPVVIPKLVQPSRTPDSFPKVDSVTQKARDSDRKRILEDELHTQEAKLAELKKAYNNGEPDRQGNERNYQRYLDRVQQMKTDIARSESDIDSIKDELSKLQ